MSDLERIGARGGRPSPAWAGVFVLAALVVADARTASAQQYSTPQEAYNAGVAYFPLRQYAKARGPLEQALAMSKDDPSRLKVYSALFMVYVSAGETDKALEALDFIVSKDPSEPRRSMARRALISYAEASGKVDEIVNRYEDRLKKDPKDRPALYVLSDVYSKLKPNPQRSGELVDQLAKVMKESGDGSQSVSPSLAEQYVKAGKFKEGAAVYEQVAARDIGLGGVYLKDAAQAYLKAGDKVKALAAARAADAAAPEHRGDLLIYFWHRGLGDVYLQTGDPAAAITHYEEAIATTKIEGYASETRKQLAQAKALAKRLGVAAPATATATASPTARTTATKSGTASRTGTAKGGSIDLNRASIAQLMGVDGISEDLAIEIVQHRKKKPFESISELIELEGVDKALLSKIRPALTVGSAK